MTADFSILGCDAVSLGQKLQLFRRIPVLSRSLRASWTCLTLKTKEIRYCETPVSTRSLDKALHPRRTLLIHCAFLRKASAHGTCAAECPLPSRRHCLIFCHCREQSHVHVRIRVPSSDEQQSNHQFSFLYVITFMCGGTKRFTNYDAATICVKAIRPGLPHRFYGG